MPFLLLYSTLTYPQVRSIIAAPCDARDAILEGGQVKKEDGDLLTIMTREDFSMVGRRAGYEKTADSVLSLSANLWRDREYPG